MEDDTPKGRYIEVDLDLLLRSILAISGDKEQYEELVGLLMQRTGTSREDVVEILSSLVELITNSTRAN